MIKWSIKAGLINGNIPNQLQIVYEPDCTSLSIQYAMIEFQKKREMKEDKKDDIHVYNDMNVLDGQPTDKDQIRSILKKANCGQYYNLFISEGFDELSMVFDLTEKDLKEIGINGLGFRRKILKGIEEYKQNLKNFSNKNINKKEKKKKKD